MKNINIVFLHDNSNRRWYDFNTKGDIEHFYKILLDYYYSVCVDCDDIVDSWNRVLEAADSVKGDYVKFAKIDGNKVVVRFWPRPND